ncbi:hypothetical protein [Burkholderia sp. BCC0506]|uniref:hypothetical protein n=1 Tax=Burkholderia sp. BCC0506 TaxID=2676290 RepID=UPI001FC89556|nr:hypothetical protein [Burkholderia sp. BCC0506]
MFFATAQWNQFHCERQFNDSLQYGFIPRIRMCNKSDGRTDALQSTPGKASSLRMDERFPSARSRLISKPRSITTRADLTKSKGSANQMERIILVSGFIKLSENTGA